MSANAEIQTPQQPAKKKGKRKTALLLLTLLFVIIAVAPTDAAREKLSSEGQLTLLLGKLMTLLGDVSLSQLESRLAVWQ
ncbi:hypothetical protein ONK29_26075, partial [Salmonella enterica subsp. enterica serovar Anatum]|nr:hypothetical protein [Salmonella enterica subsp. enterica serovar Anatum]